MDIINLVKIITTLITTIIAMIIGFRVFFLDRKDWLNRWFALFFISSAIGFLIYVSYHLILNNANIIIPLMITAQIFFNINTVSLAMTVFVLEKYTKVAMSIRYFGVMVIIFFVMSIGYFIFIPSLNQSAYAIGIVDTITPPGWLLFVNVSRILIVIYVASKYILMLRKVEEAMKNRILWFTIGVIVIIIGLSINLAGGTLSSIIMEIVALIILDVGSILLFKAFYL
ncbi:MAG: hypothetical protein P8Y23_08470 [Candidatus Lokiarchaeota archaeon]